MTLSNILIFSAIQAAIVAVLGWWLKARLDGSIKHEYDRLLEAFRLELRRTEALVTERSRAFRELQQLLLGLRRYCSARSAEISCYSEFESRTESLRPEENQSLLVHWDDISRKLDEHELFISADSRSRFNALFENINMGFNMELLAASPDMKAQVESFERYDGISLSVNDVLDHLFADLGFPVEANKRKV
jgi:hypothetical protein